MKNKCLKRYLISLAIREMWIKSISNHSCLPVRMFKIKITISIDGWDAEQQYFSYFIAVNAKWFSPLLSMIGSSL
jgi:hypothetical protein